MWGFAWKCHNSDMVTPIPELSEDELDDVAGFGTVAEEPAEATD